MLVSRSFIVDFISWLFVLLWVYAAASKLLDHDTFAVQLGQSPLLSPIAGFLTWLVPFTELLLALMLFVPGTKIISFYGSFALMCLFSIYIFVITRFSEYVPCSCGGLLEKMSWNVHLLFNLIFIFLSALAIQLLSKNNLLQQNRVS